jgi:hypothetical protein
MIAQVLERLLGPDYVLSLASSHVALPGNLPCAALFTLSSRWPHTSTAASSHRMRRAGAAH